MEQVLQEYTALASTCTDKCNRELEVRFYVKRPMWETYRKSLITDACVVYEKSLNAYAGHNRIEIYFANGQKINERCIKKQAIYETRGADYKISVSTETEVPNIKLSETSFVRLKSRASCINGKWRYDFTVVHTIDRVNYDTLPSLLKQFKVEEIDSPNCSYEFEVEFIGEVLELIDLKYVMDKFSSSDTNVIYDVAKLLGKRIAYDSSTKKIKELTNNPRILTVKKYHDEVAAKAENYYVSDKADGSRALVYCHSGHAYVITDKEMATFSTSLPTCILDAEYIDGRVYVFDVMYYDQNITGLPLVDRRAILSRLDISSFGEIKPLTQLTSTLKEVIKPALEKSRPYEIDGLIFTPAGGYYDVVYKWKPPQHNTTDFLLRRLPDSEYGKHPYIKEEGSELYVLFVMVRPHDFQIYNMHQLPFYKKLFPHTAEYFPTHFNPSINNDAYLFRYRGELGDIENKVVEMIYDVTAINIESASRWRAVRVRHDRRDPNYVKVAETCFTSYYNPFTEDKLYSNPSYFKHQKTAKHKILTKYNRYVVFNVLRLIQNSALVVDLASGQGADLYAYHHYRIGRLVMSDRDSDALEEVIQRKYSIDNPKFNKYSPKSNHRMSLHVCNIDLSESHKQNLAKLSKYTSASAVVCNFAIHYVLTSPDALDNLFTLIDGLLGPGGQFIFTCFNGEDIMGLPAQWDVMSDGELKYSIHRTGEKLDYNTRIKVYMPFSGSYYEEPVVNLRKVIRYFETKGYNLVQSSSFNAYIKDYEQQYGNMSDEDIKYIGMYYFTSLRKKPLVVGRGSNACSRVGLKRKKVNKTEK